MPPDPLTTQHLFGCDFVADADMDSVVGLLLDQDDDAPPGWRCTVTPNVNHLVHYSRNPDQAQVARSATLVLPDGMPIVWASRLLGAPLDRRLTGSDLFCALWPVLAHERRPAMVLAAHERVADLLAAEHPTASCVVPPMFDAEDPAQVAEVAEQIAEACASSGARFVFIGVSMPKTHVLASALEQRWSGSEVRPMVLLLGAAAEFYLGLVPRAPQWMQRSGLEWLHRLTSDPRRLARRYLLEDPRFALLVLREWRGRRRRHL